MWAAAAATARPAAPAPPPTTRAVERTRRLGRAPAVLPRHRPAACPSALPPIRAPHSVTLVRHGQSTWNAAGIIQGSSDESVLTDKGRRQAAATRDALLGAPFDALIHSPLSRAAETAAIIWSGVKGGHPRCAAARVVVTPALREIDLHSLQGVVKAAPPSPAAAASYAAWHADPAGFELDGHAPVRDLWARAEGAWEEILTAAADGGSSPGGGGGGGGGDGGGAAAAPVAAPPPPPPPPLSTLVVAHNAVNQALLGVALGLEPAAFRRLAQANGGASEVRLEPRRGGGDGGDSPSPPPAAAACVVRLNDRGPAAGPDLRAAKSGRALLVLVAVGGEEKDTAAAAAVGRALAAACESDRAWAALRSPGVGAAVVASVLSHGLGGSAEEAPDAGWAALAARASAAAAATATPAAPSLLVLASPAEVEAALAAAAGVSPAGRSGLVVLPPFAAPPWSVACVEVAAGWAGGPAAVVRGTGWRAGMEEEERE